jgi:hypothetical protein
MLIALAVILGGFSLYLNRNWFVETEVQIVHRARPSRVGFSGNQKTEPIFFAFDRTLALTSLKVIPVSASETNKFPHPIWHLVSDSHSVPITDFAYGASIEGMRPAVKGAAPDPLKSGVKYRLLIKAGKLKAEHDFTPVAQML